MTATKFNGSRLACVLSISFLKKSIYILLSVFRNHITNREKGKGQVREMQRRTEKEQAVERLRQLANSNWGNEVKVTIRYASCSSKTDTAEKRKGR